MKMKSLSILAAAALFSGAVTSCVDDLDVTPIDPNVTLPETVLDSEDAYAQLLAKCYVSLSVSGSEGPDKDPDIDGV
ncbi:MAG: RagB/SusD family nutrient uptake outer membrane protein, partial [Bacteroidales bacterium]|nr:RagB/SusD family nutrient uptake outer membrane protein [Bacteroidales bacterium]